MLSNYIIQAAGKNNKYRFIYMTWELSKCKFEKASIQAMLMQYMFPDCIIYVFQVDEFKYTNSAVQDGIQVAAYCLNEEVPFLVDYDIPKISPEPDNPDIDVQWALETNPWTVRTYPKGTDSSIISSFIHGCMADSFASEISKSTNSVVSLCRNNRPRKTYDSGRLITDVTEMHAPSLAEAEIWKDIL